MIFKERYRSYQRYNFNLSKSDQKAQINQKYKSKRLNSFFITNSPKLTLTLNQVQQMMEIQKPQTQKFFVGQSIDALDKVKFWLNAEVLGIENDKIYIHYTGWHPKYDQFVTINSGRLLKQWEPSKPIQLNNRIDVYHPIGGWLEARVIQLGQPNQNGQITNVKVHFFRYHSKYDMWVNLKDKNQVVIIGQKSKAYGMGKRKRNINKQKLFSELARQILKQKLLKMIRQFQENNLTMKEVEGDGNCLFRTVSDQLYGEETFHNQIRQLCMKYILQQKQFFQNFMVEDVQQYVERKSRDGAWGDDIQIEALSEIYARPIEIYAMGIKPIRTFHEDNQHNVEPLKLAYIGSCHYNSIKKRSQQNKGLLEGKFGEFQNTFINSYLQSKLSDTQWINRNRDKFSHFNPLEMSIQQRIESETKENPGNDGCQNDMMQQAIEISENEQICKEIQAAELKQLQRKMQQQTIQKQLRRLEQQQLQEVKKISAMGTRPQVNKQRPYWFQDLLMMGFSQDQIWFGIEIKGYDPDSVQNFLFDNM